MLFGKKFFKKKKKKFPKEITNNFKHKTLKTTLTFLSRQKTFIERFLYFPARLAAFLK